MRSFQVRIFAIQKLKDGRTSPWRVRWTVDGAESVRSFRTRALADVFRSSLLQATTGGQPFDTRTGLPAPQARDRATTTCYQLFRDYVKARWARLAAKSRRSVVEALTSLTPQLVDPARHATPDPATLREALRLSALDPRLDPRQWPADHQAALAWLDKVSLPVADLADLDIIRATLDSLCLRLDGRPAAATVVRRKRQVFHHVCGYAVERKLLDDNPVDLIQWTAPETADAVDRRVVATPGQVASLLDALAQLGERAHRLVAFFGCLYYAGARPSEAANLRLTDCQLPGRCLVCDTPLADLAAITPTPRCSHDKTEPLWGRLHLAETNPYSGSHWTDDASPYQRRGLKHRGVTAVRHVPVPPKLVGLLCEHVARHGLAPDGRLFRGLHGGPLPTSVYGRWWQLARREALTPAQVASPLAKRPYDLRHAAASLWLNHGVPPAEVATRLGHSIAVLLRIYAHCIDNGDDTNNQRIQDALD